MTRLGRDFSNYQGNLTEADCAGISFAYVKVTEGADIRNAFAPQQCAMLRSQGVLVGYYHFFTDDTVIDQLHNFQLTAAALGETQLPLAIDSETMIAGGFPKLAVNMVNFAMNVESWTNFVPNERTIFYVDLDFYDNLEGFPWGRWVWLATTSQPTKTCLVWQSGPRPVSAADLKVIDADQFMGTDAQWAAFSGTTITPPAPTPIPLPPGAENAVNEPVIIRGSNGLPYVVCWMPGNALYIWQQQPDATWSGPAGPGGANVCFSQPSVALGQGGLPVVTCQGPGEKPVTFWQNTDGSWSGPNGLPGA